MNRQTKTLHRILFMLALIIAGEAIFALPFHVTRFFRPVVLEVFDLTATELGAAQGIYGVLAMLGHQHFFMFLAAFSLVGLLASVALWRVMATVRASRFSAI